MAVRFPWWNLAACRGMNTDLFFSDNTFSQQRAREVCRKCPAQMACLSDALWWSRKLVEDGCEADDIGIFGGMTGAERQAIICPDTVRPSQGDNE